MSARLKSAGIFFDGSGLGGTTVTKELRIVPEHVKTKGAVLKRMQWSYKPNTIAGTAPGNTFRFSVSTNMWGVGDTPHVPDSRGYITGSNMGYGFTGDTGVRTFDFSWSAPAGVGGILVKDKLYLMHEASDPADSSYLGFRCWFLYSELSLMESIQMVMSG